MKTLRVSEITKMKSTDLVKIVEKWNRYDPKVVLIANSELKKRNYNISYSLEKKQNEFSLKYNQTDINKFLDKYLKDNSYTEFFKKGIETVLKNTNSNTASESFQTHKETGNILVKNQIKTTETKSITSITLILIGNMLTTYGSIGDGWTASLTAIFGLVLFFVGLTRLKSLLDDIGKEGISKLVWAAIIGIIATIFNYIPLVGGIPAGILNLIAFILQVIGLFKLKNSVILGTKGSSGANYLLTAMFMMIFAGLFNIIPFAGGYIKSFIAFIAFIIIPFGWLKIQEAIIERRN